VRNVRRNALSTSAGTGCATIPGVRLHRGDRGAPTLPAPGEG
jgi:hypothetical protein